MSYFANWDSESSAELSQDKADRRAVPVKKAECSRPTFSVGLGLETLAISCLSIALLTDMREIRGMWKSPRSLFVVLVAAMLSLSLFIIGKSQVEGEAGELATRILELYKFYQPASMLQTEAHVLDKPKFEVADVHCHWELEADPQGLVEAMDRLGISYAVNLSGGWGKRLESMLNRYKRFAPARFEILVNIDFSEIDQPDFISKWVKFLEEANESGAAGLKVFKDLGLTIRDKSGKIVPIDDSRLDPIWEKCGELGMPVLIHAADPLAFFEPIDRFNERIMQLGRHPDWSFYGPEFPSREEVIRQRNHILEKHPRTTFIGAHIGNSAEDLSHIAEVLDEYPNFVVDISGRVAELGRQPYTARRFFLDYSDRILFGTDRYPGRVNQPRHRIYYRFLETQDEYFDYHEHDFPPTGEWKIYGVFLPDSVLEKVYHLNADRIFRH